MGVRNTLGDLHNMLMEQMERLNEADDYRLEIEVKRSQAMASITKGLIGNANAMIKAADLAAESGVKTPRLLSDGAE